MRKLWRLSIALSIWGLLAVAVLVVASQIQEWSTLKEVATVGSALGFLALASFAVSWSRVGSDLAPLQELLCAKQAGLDLFIATALALVSQGLIWAVPLVPTTAPVLVQLLVVAHVLILAIAWAIGWLTMRRLLILISRVSAQFS
jgi:hypothetical protein